MYLSPVGVTDPAEIESRVPEFMERAGYYFANWGTLYDAWMDKIKGVIGELEAMDFQPLPHREDMAVLTEGRGIGSGQLMLAEYDKLVQLTWQALGAPLRVPQPRLRGVPRLLRLLQAVWPSIPDQAIAKMVAGIDVDLFRPDEELKKLAAARRRPRRRRPDQQQRRRHARGHGRRRRRQEVAGSVGGVAPPVVQLLGGLGLLPLRQGLGRVPRHPDELHRVLRRQARARASRWPGRSRRSRPSGTGSWRSTPS